MGGLVLLPFVCPEDREIHHQSVRHSRTTDVIISPRLGSHDLPVTTQQSQASSSHSIRPYFPYFPYTSYSPYSTHLINQNQNQSTRKRSWFICLFNSTPSLPPSPFFPRVSCLLVQTASRSHVTSPPLYPDFPFPPTTTTHHSHLSNTKSKHQTYRVCTSATDRLDALPENSRLPSATSQIIHPYLLSFP